MHRRTSFQIFGPLAFLAAIASSGCIGPRVEVPTAHVGKVLSASGFEPGLRQPSTFRLPPNPLGLNPTELVLVEASDQQIKEEMKLFMPKDKLNLQFDVRGTFSIANEEQRVNKVFDLLTSKLTGPYVSTIDFDNVYAVYGEQVVLTTSRAILVKYDIEYVMAHRESVSKELEEEVRSKLSETPLTVVNFGLSAVQPPELIIEAQKASKEREVAIDRAKADRMVRLTEATAALEVARKQQLVDLLEADTQRQVGLKLAKGVNKAFVVQRVLGALEALSTGKDKVVVIPEEAFSNPAIMTAIQQKILGETKTNPPQQ